MKMPNLKKIMGLICVGGVLLSCNFAEASLVTNKFPMLTYAEQNVPTYDKPGGGQKGFISPGVALVYIKQINPDGWAYGSYPIADGKRIYRWFRMNELQGYLNFKNYEMTVESNQIVFRTSAGNSRLGSLKKNDRVTVIAERGDSKKIVYRVGGGNEYKMGWLTPASAMPDNDNENKNGDDNNGNHPQVIINGPVNIYKNKGDVNNYDINANGDVVVGTMNKDSHDNNSINIDNSQNDNRVYDQSIHDSEIDNSVNKGAKIDSENTENSHNTTNSGNKNIDNNGEQIKKEQVKEEQVKNEDKLKIEIMHNPGIDKVLKNQNTSNENKTGSNDNATGNSNTRKN